MCTGSTPGKTSFHIQTRQKCFIQAQIFYKSTNILHRNSYIKQAQIFHIDTNIPYTITPHIFIQGTHVPHIFKSYMHVSYDLNKT